MKIFKGLISLFVLFCMLSINAKRTGSAIVQPQPSPTTVVRQPVVQQPSARQTTVRQPITQQSSMQEKSYRDLVNYVKNAPNVWDHIKGQLNPEFISAMIQKARQLNLDTMQLQALLETARDVHAIFFNDRPRDTAILNWVNHQIREALAQR